MIFRVQRFLEDHFEQRGFSDPDQYAVRLANLYAQRRWVSTRAGFETSTHRVSTVFFLRNRIDDRRAFERSLLDSLDKKFPKKNSKNDLTAFPGGVVSEKKKAAAGRVSVREILELFRRAVQSRAVDSFWSSRTKGKLQRHPETAGQGLLSVFLQGVLRGRRGLALREVASGVGWVDVVLILAATPHLLELKILRTSGTPGVEQLGTYMTDEGRREGWLVVFDVRSSGSRRTPVPNAIDIPAGKVRVVLIDVNPVPPSRRNRRTGKGRKG